MLPSKPSIDIAYKKCRQIVTVFFFAGKKGYIYMKKPQNYNLGELHPSQTAGQIVTVVAKMN